MLFIRADSPSSAWESAFRALVENGKKLEFNLFYKNEAAAIEINNILGEAFSKYFPMDKEEIEIICNYFITGQGNINHKWTQLYRKRIFNEGENYIQRIISILKAWPDCPRAQISLWNNKIDHERPAIAPCLQILWFKIIDNTLVLHVHMRTADCYGKLLMNFNEFIALQKMVASELSLPAGKYIHFIDSLHFHTKDKESVEKLYGQLCE